jgi:hypothetical protein
VTLLQVRQQFRCREPASAIGDSTPSIVVDWGFAMQWGNPVDESKVTTIRNYTCCAR